MKAPVAMLPVPCILVPFGAHELAPVGSFPTPASGVLKAGIAGEYANLEHFVEKATPGPNHGRSVSGDVPRHTKARRKIRFVAVVGRTDSLVPPAPFPSGNPVQS